MLSNPNSYNVPLTRFTCYSSTELYSLVLEIQSVPVVKEVSHHSSEGDKLCRRTSPIILQTFKSLKSLTRPFLCLWELSKPSEVVSTVCQRSEDELVRCRSRRHDIDRQRMTLSLKWYDFQLRIECDLVQLCEVHYMDPISSSFPRFASCSKEYSTACFLPACLPCQIHSDLNSGRSSSSSEGSEGPESWKGGRTPCDDAYAGRRVGRTLIKAHPGLENVVTDLAPEIHRGTQACLSRPNPVHSHESLVNPILYSGRFRTSLWNRARTLAILRVLHTSLFGLCQFVHVSAHPLADAMGLADDRRCSM